METRPLSLGEEAMEAAIGAAGGIPVLSTITAALQAVIAAKRHNEVAGKLEELMQVLQDIRSLLAKLLAKDDETVVASA